LVLVESRERDRPSERTPEKVAPGAAACAPPRTPPAAGSDAAAAAAAAETTSSSSSSSSSPERVRARSIASPVPGPREPPRRALRILHFNDVYDVLPSKREPAGGAALFVSKLRALSRSGGFGADGGAGGDDDGDDDEDDPGPLVLFSGDALSPSNISSTTKGRHMVEVLNACGVHCACVGNHDLDFGCEHFAAMQAESAFPWLCANAHHAVDGSDGMARGAALGGAQELCVLQHGGWRVGVVGLVEEEWLGACSTLDPSTLSYVDFVEAGRAAAQRLRGEHGCDVVIALTHLRLHNDLRLAAGCGDAVDLVLGGHDHDYHASCDNAHGCWVVKSGTDFRELSSLVIDPPAQQQPAQQQQQQQQRPRPRPRVRAVARHEVRGDDVSIAPDAPTAALVGRYAAALAASMCKVVGRSAADLDARFAAVRTRETNVGNWVADMMRNGCQADIAICTGGTLRADCVFPAGPITEGALTKLLPFMDELRVVSLSGAQVVAALENGVSRWPVLDGRFPQVSGVAFAFDPRLPPGARVVAGSVRVGGSPSALEPLLQEAQYAVAVPDFVGRGKEGYSMFPEGRLMWDSEVCPILPTLVRNHLSQLNTTKNLEEWERGEAAEALVQGVQEAQQQQQQQQQQQVLLGRGAAGAEGGGGSEGSRSPSSLSRGSTPCSSPSPAVSFGLFTPRSPRSPSPMVADDAEADAEAGGDGAAAAAARAAAAAARSLCGTATAAEVMSLEVHDAARQPLGLFSPALITGLRRAESSPQLKSSRSFRRLSELAAAAAAAGSAEVGRPAADEGSNGGGGGGASSGDSDDAAQPPPPSLLQRVYSLPMPTEHATAASAGNRDGDGEADGDGDAGGDSAPPPPPSLQRVFSLPIFPQLRQQASFHGLRSPFNRTPRSTRSAMMVVHPVTEGRIFNAAPELLGQQ
jgi:5'-nucleotidase